VAGQDHYIGSQAIDLDQTGSNNFYDLRIDVTANTGQTNDVINAPGGLSLAVVAPQTGDGQSSSTSKGSGGGIISGSTNTATMTSTPTVSASVLATLVSAGGDLTIESDAFTKTTAYATNGSGGFVAVGRATVNHNSGDGDLTSTASIGNNTQLIAGGDLSVKSMADNESSISSKTTTGGFVGLANAQAYSNTDFTSNVSVGSNAVIFVGGFAEFVAEGSTTGNATANAKGVGFGGDGSAKAESRANDGSGAFTTIAGSALIEASELSLEAYLNDVDLRTDASGRGGGFYSEGDGEATTTFEADSSVTIGGFARLTGWEGVDLSLIHI